MPGIELRGIGKKFTGKWILRDLNLKVMEGHRLVVTGKNGRGKSTLLKMLSGHLSPSTGHIQWISNGRPLERDLLYRELSMSAPYMDPIEEFTLAELLKFHNAFKPFISGLTLNEVVSLSELSHSLHKPVKYFSSGMKQRVKLTLALLSDSRLIILDEPCANLDAEARTWYAKLVEDFGANRTIVVASNHNPWEYPKHADQFDLA